MFNTSLSRNTKGIIYALLGFSAFAFSDACAKWLGVFYNPMQIVAGASIVSTIVLLLAAPFTGGLKKTLASKQKRIHFGRAICNCLASLFVVLAFAHMSLTLFYTLIFVTPFLVTLLAIPIFKDKVGLHSWGAIIVGFIGVLVVLRPGFADINPWVFAPLIAAVFVSGLSLLARCLDKNQTILSMGFYPAVFNTAVLAPIAFAIYGVPDIAHLGIFLIAGTFAVTGLTFVALAFQTGDTAVVSPFHYSQIIWAVILGYFIFAENPDPWTLLGSTIIIGSGIYLLSRQKKIRFTQEGL